MWDADRLREDGFLLLRSVFSACVMEEFAERWEILAESPAENSPLLTTREGVVYGARNLLDFWPESIALLRSPVLVPILQSILGPRGGFVRGLFFDKPPGADWSLPWHRDQTIAVKQHGVQGRFTKPTTKAGVPHVEAPGDLLERMITARIHLDAMDERNGPLRVIPGSHRNSLDALTACASVAPVSIHCHAGDVLLMRPLLLHGSGECTPDHRGHRRIIHCEFGPTPILEDGYEWSHFQPLSSLGAF